MTWNQNWKTCCALGMKPVAYTESLQAQVKERVYQVQNNISFASKSRGNVNFISLKKIL